LTAVFREGGCETFSASINVPRPYGLAIRNDSPFRPQIDQQMQTFWSTVYPEYRMDGYVLRFASWSRQKPSGNASMKAQPAKKEFKQDSDKEDTKQRCDALF
jgi:hypothetical protein